MKQKKWLWIALGALDVAVTGFLFVIHILMLANIAGKPADEVEAFANGEGLLPYLVKNLTVYLWAFVIPLVAILIANVIGLILYIRKYMKKEPAKLSDLSQEEKEALKKELLKDLEK